tara:strand:+ start:417 stop:1010 length:594 start_codon:yes stop_codon:yes gene_type:complete
MKKPILDEFDRWFLKSKTPIGKTIKRKYKIIKIMKKLALIFAAVVTVFSCTPDDDLPQPIEVAALTQPIVIPVDTVVTDTIIPSLSSPITLGTYECKGWEHVNRVDTFFIDIKQIFSNYDANVHHYSETKYISQTQGDRMLSEMSTNHYRVGKIGGGMDYQIGYINERTIRLFYVAKYADGSGIIDTLQQRNFTLIE